jgi:hypothetical protein
MAEEITSQTLISNAIQYSHHYNANNSSVKPLTVIVENVYGLTEEWLMLLLLYCLPLLFKV